MNNEKQRRFTAMSVGGMAILLFLQAVPAVAQEDDSRNPFSFSASQSFSYDSNIYKYPDNATPKDGRRNDSFSITNLGVNFDKDYSRQSFHAGLSLGKTLYRVHSEQNNTSGNGRLLWNWRAGDRWSGDLGYSYSVDSINFDSVYIDADRQKIMRHLGRANVSADFWWHPDWATGLAFSDVRNSYANDVMQYDKYNSQSVSLNLTYRPSTGNRIVLGYVFEQGEYPNQPEVAGSLRDWNRRDLRLSGQWRLTGVSQLSGYVGYTERTYSLASNRDFSGVTGKLAFHWTPTGKALIDLSWRREIGAEQDLISNYAVSQGWAVQPTWVFTSKIRIGASYEYLNRDYGGDPGILPGWLVPPSNPKEAKVKSYGLNLQYLPIPSANITLGYRRYERSAELNGYRGQAMWLSGNITF
ncbi:MAG: hypothetical protein FWD67_02145 [Betaproteobacteria bacterium]|nr:hypothetical protein [Betaproteobacteria bacterium]